MAMRNEDLLRFYLRDSRKPGKTPFFTEEELLHMLEANDDSVEAAAALGWLMKAGSTFDAPTTLTIGQMSETRAQVTESYKVALRMYDYWRTKAAEITGVVTTARWFTIEPADGVAADLIATARHVYEQWRENDLSRLL